MKNFHKLIKQNKLNVEFTKDEITALQQFLDNKISYEDEKLSSELVNALYKIGLVVPIQNRGGCGKKIENLLFS